MRFIGAALYDINRESIMFTGILGIVICLMIIYYDASTDKFNKYNINIFITFTGFAILMITLYPLQINLINKTDILKSNISLLYECITDIIKIDVMYIISSFITGHIIYKLYLKFIKARKCFDIKRYIIFFRRFIFIFIDYFNINFILSILGINIINKYKEGSFEEFLRLLFPFII